MDWIKDQSEKIALAIREMILGWMREIMQELKEFLQFVAMSILDKIASLFAPWIGFALELLPDPTGVGFRYVFEACHFASGVIDFAALKYVAVTLVSMHLFVMGLHLINFILMWVWRLWKAIPLLT